MDLVLFQRCDGCIMLEVPTSIDAERFNGLYAGSVNSITEKQMRETFYDEHGELRFESVEFPVDLSKYNKLYTTGQV
jgi:hypothetical protein